MACYSVTRYVTHSERLGQYVEGRQLRPPCLFCSFHVLMYDFKITRRVRPRGNGIP